MALRLLLHLSIAGRITYGCPFFATHTRAHALLRTQPLHSIQVVRVMQTFQVCKLTMCAFNHKDTQQRVLAPVGAIETSAVRNEILNTQDRFAQRFIMLENVNKNTIEIGK